MRYFIGGFSWNGKSQFERFIRNNIWENGYQEDKYSDLVSQISVGDLFALKSTYVKGKKPKAKSYLKIKRIGIVTRILSNSSIQIEWKDGIEFDLTNIRWYANTLEEISEKVDIQRIFGNIKKELQMTNFFNLLNYKKQIILQGPPGTGKTRQAKKIAKEILDLSHVKELENNEQFKLVQFHPSYTYEDFVRGIIAESQGDRIEYKNVNKTLGEFAQQALKNYLDSKKDAKTVSKELHVRILFESFIESINDNIEQQNGYLPLTGNVGLISTDDFEAFRYKGQNDGWLKNGNRMLYNDIIQAFLEGNKERQDVKKNQNLSGLARQHASYFVRVLNLFQEFIKDENIDSSSELINEKPYILVIDEINRANLSSVLGELIYALEYRGESIESMYEVDGSKKLILPPNLYIIGTMNTADRSVGHIDYAIRRRFAFVDVLPKDLSNDDTIVFHKDLFEKVSRLFIKNYDEYLINEKTPLKAAETLSSEFRPEDVWLGHSYFIQKKEKDENGNEIFVPNEFSIRLEYEIKPILMEYVKDGILIGDTIKDEILNLGASI